MSREERRNYQRMMRNMERGAALPPAARARAERNAARRAKRRPPEQTATFTTRFWVRTLLIAIAVGFLAFSTQWGSGMPFALYVGIGVAIVTVVLLVGLRLLTRRATTATGGRP